MTRTLLALDGNSVLHRSFHASAHTGYHTDAGRPGWAIRGLLDQLVAAVDRACADVVVVGFDDPHTSVRRDRWPAYKAQRPDKPETLVSQLADAVGVLQEMGVAVIVPPGLEADDVLAAAARVGREAGWQTVLATSDRDAFALIDDTTRVLRLINGGVDASPMLTPQRLRLLTGVTPAQYRDLAALRGDPSDNLPGVRGVGKVVGARLLAEFGSARDMFADLAAGGERCRACAGPALAARLATAEAYERWRLNHAVMSPDDGAITDDHTLALLPLSAGLIQLGFNRYGLSPRRAIGILCGAEATAPQPRDSDAAWRPPHIRPARFPPLPKQAAVAQETLF